MKRGRPRLDGLDALLPGKEFVRDQIRNLDRPARRKPGRPPGAVTMTGRDYDFIERFRRGETLQQIGDSYGITRERVRQRLAKHGITRQDGGIRAKHVAKVIANGEALKVRAESRCMKTYGISLHAFYEITGCRSTKGHRTRKNPITGAYLSQCKSAKSRGINWQMTLAEWWRVWMESGKWGERGRGPGYCMARWADEGPYSVENVYICTNSENMKDSYITKPAAGRLEKRRQNLANGAHQ